MALKTYRRHREECEGGRPEGARTGQFEQGRRGWKKRGCLTHVSGTLAGKVSRKHTGKTDWEEAKALAAQWEKANSWDGQGPGNEPVSLPAATTATDPTRVTGARAILAFAADFEDYAAQATRKKHKRLLRPCQGFSDAKGYAAVDQSTTLDVREFRSTWPVGARTAARTTSTVTKFFEFCRSNKWMPDNPARMVRNPRGRDTSDLRHEQKLPFICKHKSTGYDGMTNTHEQACKSFVASE